jgi:hypothetical protein
MKVSQFGKAIVGTVKLILGGITHSPYRRASSACRGDLVITPYESLMPSETTADYIVSKSNNLHQV